MTAARTSNPIDAEPAWDIARLFPPQGEWSEEEYFTLESITGARVELTDGRIEVLPMPTIRHQLILQWLFKAIDAFVSARSLGLVLVSGTRVRLRAKNIREPDIVFIRHDPARITNQFLRGADLAVEIVSADDPARDYVTKRGEYAAAGIGEYWIVDPFENRVQVLALSPSGVEYQLVGDHRCGERAASRVLAGFEISVAELFAAADIVPNTDD